MRIGRSGYSAAAGPIPASAARAIIPAKTVRMIHFLRCRDLSSRTVENTQKVGALLYIADRWAAHPGAGIHRLRVAEEDVESFFGPMIAIRPRGLKLRRVVERRIARDRPTNHAHELRSGLLP